MTRAAALVLLTVLECGAQTGTPPLIEETMKRSVETSANALNGHAPAPMASCGSMSGPGREECEAALRAEFRYETTRLAHRSAVFAWQLYSSKLIFGLLTMIVLTGIGLTVWQFRHIFSRRRAGGEELNSELEITMEKIRVNSSVVGVVVLSLSLAFYFLYLRYVYPVEVIR